MVFMVATQPRNSSAPLPKGRLMLCNIAHLGDTILCNSILESACRTYAKVDYICGWRNAELLRNDSRLNEIVVFRNWLRDPFRLFKSALSKSYDGFIDLKTHQSRTSLFIASLFRSPVKTGWNSVNFRPFHRDVKGVCAPNQHQTKTMQRVGRLAGLEPGEYKPSLVLTADSINWFRRNYTWERPFIFLNISASSPDRIWAVEKWAQYVRGCGLSNEHVLVNGIPGDRNNVEKLCGQLPGAVVFQPRQFTDVAAALNDARLVLTMDTGIVHASSALNKPIVALYCGSAIGAEYKPLSTRRLVIRSGGSVAEMDPREAVAETLQRGLP
jgi:ADP-heptose:LPS heptosyltransferase